MICTHPLFSKNIDLPGRKPSLLMRHITLWTNLTGVPLGRFYFRELAKLIVRATRHPQLTLWWIRFLNSNPTLIQLTRISPRLASKIYHPYFNDKMNCGARLSVLVAHYEFMLQLGLDSLLLRAAQSPVSLGNIRGKFGDYFTMQLSAVAPMEREGDLLLQVTNDGKTLYSIAFCFFKNNGSMALGIGCIQGPAGENRLDYVRHATHALHGLRPKNLMVRLVQQLGVEFGCRDIFLVGNVNRAADYAIQKKQVHADYDSLWQEMGAQRMLNGDFRLACTDLEPPDLQSIPSKKRSEARKRHDILLEFSKLLIKNINIERNALRTYDTGIVISNDSRLII